LLVDVKHELSLAYKITNTKAGDGETLPDMSQAPNEVTGFAVYREPMRAKWIAVCGELAGGACGECSADSKMNIVA